jgi:hypothetical protein
MQKGFLPPKPFKFILNNVDTTTETSPILPIYLVENISDYYTQKEPAKSREIIRASKTIGLKNESVSKFLGGMYQNVNVYKTLFQSLIENMLVQLATTAIFIIITS